MRRRAGVAPLVDERCYRRGHLLDGALVSFDLAQMGQPGRKQDSTWDLRRSNGAVRAPPPFNFVVHQVCGKWADRARNRYTGGLNAALKEKGRGGIPRPLFFSNHHFKFEMAELIAQRRCAHSLGVDRAAK
jgi:hypothetical protein